MGCDGGTIPTRDELVRTRKKPEQKDKDSVRLYKWQHCHLTQQKLSPPIVACQLGHLYDKEAIIEKLLDGKANRDASETRKHNADHIKSLKDVRELVLVDNPAFNRSKCDASVGDGGYVDRLVSPYVCPISGLEMNGKFKFVFDWTNGKVLSERGHKAVQAIDEQMRIPEDNLIIINPEEEDEINRMETNMETRKAREKAEKALKKAAKRKLNQEQGESEASSVATVRQPSKPSNGSVNDEGAKGCGSKKGKLSCVQSDPTKSEVYKSLFSSHKSAANKPKGHWVTFDPRYN